MRNMQLRDLYLGAIDAKYELLSNSLEEKERFEKSFLVPGNILIENFLEGKQFYITGLKGSGKTALMRYIGIQAEKKYGAHCKYILFKSQFNEDDKKDLTKAFGAVVLNKEDIPTESDYEAIWGWLLHKYIVEEIAQKDIPVFEENKDWEKYKMCVLAPTIDNENTGLKRLIPKIKHGVVEVGGKIREITGRLGLDLEFEDAEQTKIKFNYLVRQADHLFEKLEADFGTMFIFVDELELSYVSKKVYERDARIIRDLVLAVEKINTLCRQRFFNIKLICAIRSEVMSIIAASGKEINKPVGSFGAPIIWHHPGGDIIEHPILNVLLKRIVSSEEDYGDSKTRQDLWEIWNRWFPKLVQDTPTTQYILHHTWYRPRDIVRMLTLAQSQFPKETFFKHSVFDSIRKQYSADSWVEMTEELRAAYKEAEIDGIRRIFYGYKPYFTFEELYDRIENLKAVYDAVNVLMENRKLTNVLIHLYKIGIIGNINEDRKHRWAHRGDDEILLEQTIVVHRALWKYLSL